MMCVNKQYVISGFAHCHRQGQQKAPAAGTCGSEQNRAHTWFGLVQRKPGADWESIKHEQENNAIFKLIHFRAVGNYLT